MVDVDVTWLIDGMQCPGLFCVKSTHPGKPFAQPCDSGAAVIDIEKKQILGYVVATYCEKEREVNQTVLCVRLDTQIRFFQQRWQLHLSMNQTLYKVEEPEVS